MYVGVLILNFITENEASSSKSKSFGIVIEQSARRIIRQSSGSQTQAPRYIWSATVLHVETSYAKPVG